MCAEGAGIEYHQAQALVKKYTDKRSALARGMLTEPPPPTEEVPAVEQRTLQHNGETFVCDPVPASPARDVMDTEMVSANKSETLREWFESREAPKPPENVEVDDWLGALLAHAREAEIHMFVAKNDWVKAEEKMTAAEQKAVLAWKEFNEALRSSLPKGSVTQVQP